MKCERCQGTGLVPHAQSMIAGGFVTDSWKECPACERRVTSAIRENADGLAREIAEFEALIDPHLEMVHIPRARLAEMLTVAVMAGVDLADRPGRNYGAIAACAADCIEHSTEGHRAIAAAILRREGIEP